MNKENNHYLIIKTMIGRLHQKGMTYLDIGCEIGVDVKTVYRWVANKSEAKVSNFLALVSLCVEKGVQLDDLFYFSHLCPFDFYCAVYY